MKNNKIIAITSAAFVVFASGCLPQKSVPTPADTTAPLLAEITPVGISHDNNTPDYTFSSNEAGSISYSGTCSSADSSAVAGNNTITFNALGWNAAYGDCEITVTDAAGNASTPLEVTAFRVIKRTPLNDTGLDWCADNTTNYTGDEAAKAAGCISVAGSHPGQDALYGRDADNASNDSADGHKGFSYTKLDANGDDLAASAPSWACVRDNVTGLVWEVKTDNGLRDKDHTYTWYSTDASNNGGNAGTANGGSCSGGTGCDTDKYVADVNALNSGIGLCGHNDWRLPTKHELQSLVARDRVNPVIDSNWFPNTQSNYYWSASAYAGNSSNAWLVYFYDGHEVSSNKGFSGYVRLVRAGQ